MDGELKEKAIKLCALAMYRLRNQKPNGDLYPFEKNFPGLQEVYLENARVVVEALEKEGLFI